MYNGFCLFIFADDNLKEDEEYKDDPKIAKVEKLYQTDDRKKCREKCDDDYFEGIYVQTSLENMNRIDEKAYNYHILTENINVVNYVNYYIEAYWDDDIRFYMDEEWKKHKSKVPKIVIGPQR